MGRFRRALRSALPRLAGLSQTRAARHRRSKWPLSLPLSLPISWLIAATAQAADFNWIASEPRSEVWVNPGWYSLHFDRTRNLEDANPGLGVEYRYSTVHALTAGFFHNSDRRRSRYLGGYWQPLGIGPLRLGAAFGLIDGYPRMRDGGWFPTLVPTVSAEVGRLGASVMVVPGYKDKLYGAVSLQLRLRLR